MAANTFGFTGIIPENVSLQANIDKVIAYKQSHTAEETLEWFRSQVAPGQPWDFKSLDAETRPPNTSSVYEDFGNFHYGIVGTALGVSPDLLKSLAGGAQLTSDINVLTSLQTYLGSIDGINAPLKLTTLIDYAGGAFTSLFGNNYGWLDNSGDQTQIDAGIYAANNAGYQSDAIENKYAVELIDKFTNTIILASITVTAETLSWYEDLLTAGIELFEDIQNFGTELVNSVEKFIGGLMDSAESQLDEQPDYGNLSFQCTTSNGKTVEQTTSATSNNLGYISTIMFEGKTVIQRVSNTISGVEIKASFVADSNGELQLSSIDSINGEVPSDTHAALVALKEAGLTSDMLSNGTADATLANSIGSAASAFDIANNSALQNLIDGFSDFKNDVNSSETAQTINTYGPSIIDALSLIKAIQSGEPLPVVVSGIRLANDISMISNNPNYVLSGAASAASGVLSLMSLDAALKNGDGWAIATSSAYTISFAASAYSSFAETTSGLSYEIGQQLMGSGVDHMGTNALGLTDGALPYLNLVLAIQSGDETAITVAAVSFIPGMQWVGLTYGIYNMIDSLFGGHDIPDPWGTGHFVWDGTSIKIESAGETGGNEAVSSVMQNVLTVMNSLIEQQRLTNPTSSLGIISNRMPSVAYDMSGYRYTDIDPLTGEERHPSLRFDTSGNPYNATAGSSESYRSITEAIIISALERNAIAPMWEVETAKMQTDAGDPKAGLTEEARAGGDGQLAAAVTGDTQTFRPVSLDLNNNGQIDILSKSTSGVSFDVDDSGYLKETAWIGNTDAFLTLDRDYNGETNSGEEMFSNSTNNVGYERRIA